MAIIIDWYENPVPSGQTDGGQSVSLHPRLSGNGVLTDEEVVKKLSDRNAVSVATVKAVLQGLSDLLRLELADGKQVNVPGLGFFTPGLTTTERILRNTPRKVEKVKVDCVHFRVEKSLLKELEQADVQRTKNPVSSKKHDEESIEEGMTQLFLEHRFVTRVMVQEKFQMTPSTATRLINRLKKEHKLINVGTANSPMYMAEVGCYE